MDTVSRLMQGAVDLHLHPSPSPFPRELDTLEASLQADAAGMRAILIKSHHHSTAPDVALLTKHIFRGLKSEVFGGVVLNSYVGGLNPYVVDFTIRLGGRMVWFPTLSSANHIRHCKADPKMKFPSSGQEDLPEEGIALTDDGGRLRPEARLILELVARADIAVSPGHASVPEILAFLQAAREAGVKRVVVNHPEFVVEASEEHVREFVALGALIEHSVAYYHPEHLFYTWPVEQLVRWIDVAGPAKTVLASDLGQKNNPLPVAGLQYMLSQLLDRGIGFTDLEMMVKRNPAWLLRLES